jgi:hypothetical protein
MFQTKVVQKIRTQILCLKTFFFFDCAIFKTMWKNITELDRPQITIQHMCIACYKHILRTWSIYYFFTTTMVAWTSVNVMLYVHCLSCVCVCVCVRACVRVRGRVRVCVYQNTVCAFIYWLAFLLQNSSWKQVTLSLIYCNCTQSLQENHGIYEYLKIIHNCNLQHSSLLIISNHPVTWLYHDNKNYQEQ